MKHKPFLLFMVFICMLTDCSAPGTEPSEPPVVSAEIQAARPDLDWRTDSWKFDTLSGTNHDLYITGYMQDLDYDTGIYDIVGSSFFCLEDKFYRLDRLEQSFMPEFDEVGYYLSCCDTETGEIWHEKVPLPVLEEYAENQVVPMKGDMVNEKEYVLFLCVYDSDQKVIAYPAVHINLDGEQLSVTDLYPAMQSSGIEIQAGYFYTYVYTDRQGYYYLLADQHCLTGLDQGRIMILDAEGNPVDVIGSEDINTVARYVMKDPDGNAVFEIDLPVENEVQLVGYRPPFGQKLFAQVPLEPRTPKAMTEDGYLYYATGEGKIYRWDLYTGLREFCINYHDLGIDSNAAEVIMAVGGDGQLALLEGSLGASAICQLGVDPEKAKDTIRMVSLVRDCQYVSDCAIDYSRNNPDYSIRVDKPNMEGLTYIEALQTMEDYRTRALAELVAGNGADIYYVTAEDMEMLYEKGILADLSDVLPQEYVDAIFPGALGCGVIDGKQMGLAPDGYVTVVMADSSLWTEDRWSWEEAMAVKEAHPDRNQLLVLHSLTRLNGYGETAIREMYLRYLTETPFLDLEARTCDFDNPQFIWLLEMIQNMDPELYREHDQNYSETAANQQSVAFMEDIWDFPQFAFMMSKYEKSHHPVGFPSQNSQGNYWTCDSFLVVNRNTAYWEQIKAYLISLFDHSRQLGHMGAVRNDMIQAYNSGLKGQLHYDDYDPFHSLKWGTYIIPEKPDGPPGSTWDREYLELLNSAVPYRNRASAVEDIVLEELDSYFSGDKDAETVAALIQNRVQLYLDEQK